MATNTSGASSDFIKNLGRMYGTYTGGFLAFIVLLAILEMVGVPNKILGYLFVFFTLAVYAVIGVMGPRSRRSGSDFTLTHPRQKLLRTFRRTNWCITLV